jgi:hypothetical protein
MTLGIIILGIMTRSPIMPGIVSLDIMTLSMTWHDDTWHNGT